MEQGFASRGQPGPCECIIVTRPSLTDQYDVDIFAQLITEQGKLCIILSGEIIGKDGDGGESATVSGMYLWLLVAQLYHDLVTAEFTNKAEVAGQEIKSPALEEEYGDHWVSIPRIVNINSVTSKAGYRTAISGKVRQPHGVSGHPRKGKMSGNQRDSILKFEQTTGLTIMALLDPEKETYVLPFTKPKGSEGEILLQPKFVSYRLQQRIAATIEKMREKNQVDE